mmetsp:Transcript_15754/g.31952  ORF Transcript_15754/g.31952 Transcript_15754/m.31952 type:complete len:100 (-) Transcript_15754:2075-2374(-)
MHNEGRMTGRRELNLPPPAPSKLIYLHNFKSLAGEGRMPKKERLNAEQKGKTNGCIRRATLSKKSHRSIHLFIHPSTKRRFIRFLACLWACLEDFVWWP